MEILINELSLNGQFDDIHQFEREGLIPIIALLKEFTNKDTLLKKQDLWKSQVTSGDNLYQVLTQCRTDEATRFKSALNKLISEPFWETSRRHNDKNDYEYNHKKINDTSLAESCERDKVVISFIHEDYSSTELQISKNKTQIIDVDNLFCEEHYIEVANRKGQIDKCKYSERKFAFGQKTLLENECRFRKTRKRQQGKSVYEEISSGYYWYLDNLHQDHYEVFNNTGEHIGEADLLGKIDLSKKDKTKSLHDS
ncbi:MAG: hypothetical protein LBG28_15925 [Tannerella sp.]|jgi:hypothetical protein|nr:hypothetical protein [Tannerella sp.]